MNRASCANCIHVNVCCALSVENVENNCATYCKNYETIKGSDAYLLGWVNGRKDAEDKMMKSEFSIIPDGGIWTVAVEKTDNIDNGCLEELYKRLTSLENKLSELIPDKMGGDKD